MTTLANSSEESTIATSHLMRKRAEYPTHKKATMQDPQDPNPPDEVYEARESERESQHLIGRVSGQAGSKPAPKPNLSEAELAAEARRLEKVRDSLKDI